MVRATRAAAAHTRIRGTRARTLIKVIIVIIPRIPRARRVRATVHFIRRAARAIGKSPSANGHRAPNAAKAHDTRDVRRNRAILVLGELPIAPAGSARAAAAASSIHSRTTCTPARIALTLINRVTAMILFYIKRPPCIVSTRATARRTVFTRGREAIATTAAVRDNIENSGITAHLFYQRSSPLISREAAILLQWDGGTRTNDDFVCAGSGRIVLFEDDAATAAAATCLYTACAATAHGENIQLGMRRQGQRTRLAKGHEHAPIRQEFLLARINRLLRHRGSRDGNKPSTREREHFTYLSLTLHTRLPPFLICQSLAQEREFSHTNW